MHCRVDGKLFAAVIDRQKTAISFAFNALFTGVTVDSGGRFSAAEEPAKFVTLLTCHYKFIKET